MKQIIFLIFFAFIFGGCVTSSSSRGYSRASQSSSVRLIDNQDGRQTSVTRDQIGSYTRSGKTGTRVILKTGEIYETSYDYDSFEKMLNGTYEGR